LNESRRRIIKESVRDSEGGIHLASQNRTTAIENGPNEFGGHASPPPPKKLEITTLSNDKYTDLPSNSINRKHEIKLLKTNLINNTFQGPLKAESQT
jgi:hypothetical protein